MSYTTRAHHTLWTMSLFLDGHQTKSFTHAFTLRWTWGFSFNKLNCVAIANSDRRFCCKRNERKLSIYIQTHIYVRSVRMRFTLFLRAKNEWWTNCMGSILLLCNQDEVHKCACVVQACNPFALFIVCSLFFSLLLLLFFYYFVVADAVAIVIVFFSFLFWLSYHQYLFYRPMF